MHAFGPSQQTSKCDFVLQVLSYRCSFTPVLIMIAIAVNTDADPVYRYLVVLVLFVASLALEAARWLPVTKR